MGLYSQDNHPVWRDTKDPNTIFMLQDMISTNQESIARKSAKLSRHILFFVERYVKLNTFQIE
ncbi:hypothetical protein G9A89_004871 [Geosiphon pyriformis]|nr:hypothetical protein G9A89_004871 [Geosiphon pyriformis]